MALNVCSNSILFTNIEAFSNDTVGIESLENTSQFHIPGLTGNLVAFNINGNSMFPTIKTGDMVICQPLFSIQDIKDNDICAVVTGQATWVKRVQKHLDSNGQWTHLRLVSDNFQEFAPFLIPLIQVKRLLKVKHKLTGLEKY